MKWEKFFDERLSIKSERKYLDESFVVRLVVHLFVSSLLLDKNYSFTEFVDPFMVLWLVVDYFF